MISFILSPTEPASGSFLRMYGNTKELRVDHSTAALFTDYLL